MTDDTAAWCRRCGRADPEHVAGQRCPRCGGPGSMVMTGEPYEARQRPASDVEVLPAGFDPRKSQWRVGHKLGRTIYAQTPEGGDFFLGLVESRELAKHIVALQNREAH